MVAATCPECGHVNRLGHWSDLFNWIQCRKCRVCWDLELDSDPEDEG